MISFCQQCGQSVTYGVPPEDNRERGICQSCGFIHYENPRIVTGVLPIWKDQVLLCKRAIEPRHGLWTIPSGFMENNETLEQGAIREAQEESNVDITLKRFHTIYSLPHVNQVYMLFLAAMNTDVFSPGHETSDTRLYALDAIPWDQIAFSSVTFALQKYIEDSKAGIGLDDRLCDVHSGVFRP